MKSEVSNILQMNALKHTGKFLFNLEGDYLVYRVTTMALVGYGACAFMYASEL